MSGTLRSTHRSRPPLLPCRPWHFTTTAPSWRHTGWCARWTTSPRPPASRYSAPAGAPPTPRWPPAPCSPSPPSTCAGWAATFSRWCIPVDRRLPRLASVGRAGSGASAAGLRAEGFDEMPMRGDVRSATVPGCVDGWLALHGRFGRLPLAEVLAPAREYAVSGFPASPLLARAVTRIAGVAGADDYFRSGPVRVGDVVRRPLLARAFDAIVEGGREAFYGGEFGAGLDRAGRRVVHRRRPGPVVRRGGRRRCACGPGATTSGRCRRRHRAT